MESQVTSSGISESRALPGSTPATGSHLTRIAEILGKAGPAGCFAARRSAAADDLHLEVQGLGGLGLPVSRRQALQLCRLARPAPYGRGEDTLLDRRVRDTWKIPKSRVKIDGRRWNRTLLPMLDGLRADLGLPRGCRLRAELHSFLVYGPGQFFLPHQDSEKADAMVGTLVVVLPSAFEGGELVIAHQGQQVVDLGSRENLSFVAFYADCRHEVRPVKDGYRVALTYNLILDGGAAPTRSPEPAIVDGLVQSLRGYFTTPVPARKWRGPEGPARPPSRLVYLLDHEYTVHGLDWRRLKGSDRVRAAALRAAAERCGCELVLALARIHEAWDCGPDEGRHLSDWQADWAATHDSTDNPDYKRDAFLGAAVHLIHWIDPAGGAATPIVPAVFGDEVSCSTPTSALEPYDSWYERYTGNDGNSMDYWYRRAALVLWPRERGFAVRAEASPDWALAELERRLRNGGAAEAGELAASLLPFWTAAVDTAGDDDGLLDAALRVADGLAAPDLAAALLRPFEIAELTLEEAPALASLARRYGADWLQRLRSGR